MVGEAINFNTHMEQPMESLSNHLYKHVMLQGMINC